MTRAVLLRAADRVVRPWKNGGGTTQDVALFPPHAGLADFGWRLSIAVVDAAGPFSIFPGIDRHLAVLEGRMALTIAGQAPQSVRTCADDPLHFPGDAEMIGRPVGGPVTDLNLMIRRDAFRGRLTAMHGLAQTTACDTAIIVVRGAATIWVQGEPTALAPLDALLLPRGAVVRAAAPLLLAEIDPR